MSNEPYTNFDLESAEDMLIAAGSPEQAKAMRQYTAGIRNFVQGEFGMSFVSALDGIVGKHIGPLADRMAEFQQEIQDGFVALDHRFHSIEQNVQALTIRVAELSQRLAVGEARLDRKRVEIDQLKAQLASLLEARGDG